MKEEEFKKIFLPMHVSMFRQCMILLKNIEEASDCVQDAYTKLWEMRSRLKNIENLEAYCMVTVRRYALDRLRKQKSHKMGNIDEVSNYVSDDYHSRRLEDEEKLEEVKRVMEKLPENQRLVMTLSSVMGLSNSEISAETGLSHENVRVLLSRGRTRLKTRFGKRK